MFTPTPHPILPVPDLAAIEACAAREGCDAERAFVLLHSRREKIIREERRDPLRSGWEPTIWRVCDALCGFPWTDGAAGAAMRAARFSCRLRL